MSPTRGSTNCLLIGTCLYLLYCTLASCSAVYCNQSCLWVCDSGRAGGWAGGVQTLLQPVHAQCLRLSDYYCHVLAVLQSAWSKKDTTSFGQQPKRAKKASKSNVAQMCLPWGTGIIGLMIGMTTLPQGNQELLVIRNKVGRPQVSLG